MKPYHSGIARLRAIYQLPTPAGNAAVLELHLSERGRVVDSQWPAELVVSCRLAATVSRPWNVSSIKTRHHECEASYHQPLPFAPQTFDVVILHHTLDELASAFRQTSSRQIAEDWLRQIVSIIRPGGVVVGCGLNRTNPGSWLRNAGLASATAPARALGIVSCKGLLVRVGFDEPRVFNLWPDSTEPSTIASVDRVASKRAFRYELESRRAALNLPGYLARRVLVELGLNRFLEETLFFWGYKPC
jgi:SAM-dependent methyltransferase